MSKERKISINQKHINYILKDIPIIKSLPNAIAVNMRQNMIDIYKKQLNKQKIYKSLLPKLKEEIERSYYKSLVSYGESVGIVTAQSLGEKQTQMTLNSFHSAGCTIATVVTGVPRFSELLNSLSSTLPAKQWVFIILIFLFKFSFS